MVNDENNDGVCLALAFLDQKSGTFMMTIVNLVKFVRKVILLQKCYNLVMTEI